MSAFVGLDENRGVMLARERERGYELGDNVKEIGKIKRDRGVFTSL